MNTLFTNEDPGKEDLLGYTQLNKIKILFNWEERLSGTSRINDEIPVDCGIMESRLFLKKQQTSLSKTGLTGLFVFIYSSVL